MSLAGYRIVALMASAQLVWLVSSSLAQLTLSSLDCSRQPESFAIGFESPVRSVDVNGDGTLEGWRISNPYGNLLYCEGDGVSLPCSPVSYWHHTGVDFLIDGPLSYSGDREIYAVDNGVVVYTGEPVTLRGKVVAIKHLAPPGVKFLVPSFEENYSAGTTDFLVKTPPKVTDTVVSYYLHLGEVSLSLGDSVSRGDLVGRTYDYSDFSDGTYAFVPHLHFEIWGKCSKVERNGYDMVNAQFRAAASDLLVDPMVFVAENAEVMRVRALGARSGGEVSALGYGFGEELGSVVVTGYGSEAQTSPVFPDVPSYEWSNQEVRFNILEAVEQPEVIYLNNFVRSLEVTVASQSGLERRVGYPFRDIRSHFWYSSHATQLWKDGLLEGFGGSGFSLPSEPITRAEFLKLAVLAVCPSLSSGESCVSASGAPPFDDVTGDDWFYVYVREAWASGWIDTDGRDFRPSEPILRAESAKLISRGLGLALSSTDSVYSDVNSGEWFAPFVMALRMADIMEGYADGTFRPSEELNRAEAFKLVDESFGSSGGPFQ